MLLLQWWLVCNIDSGSSSSEIAKPSGGGRGTTICLQVHIHTCFLRWYCSTVNTIAAAKHILPAVVLLKHNKEAIKGYCFFSAPLRTRGKILASMRSFFIPASSRLSKKTFELKLNNATVAISHSTKPKKKTSQSKEGRKKQKGREVVYWI